MQIPSITSNRVTVLPVIWGLLHCLNDWTAGYLLTSFSIQNAPSERFIWYAVYALLAFGGQLPIGLLLDKTKQTAFSGYFFILILIAAISLSGFFPTIAIVLSGIASAGIHVVGGSICLQLQKDKSGSLGIFAATGVIGLTLGVLAGSFLLPFWFTFSVIPVIICLVVIYRSGFPVLKSQIIATELKQNKFDWIVILILLVMVIRSLVFDIINYFSSGFSQGLIIIGVCAFIGKLAGGYIADKFGSKTTIYISLGLALVLLHFSKNNIYTIGFGIACLQCSVPIFFGLIRNQFPKFPATSSALSFGSTIALGGLPFYILKPKDLIKTWYSAEVTWLLISVVILSFAWYFLRMYLNSKMRKAGLN